MSLASVKETYEELGRTDPLYAVLTHKRFRNNRWDPDAFFSSGVREIGRMLEHVEKLGFPLRFDRALDFGCGVGRLSQALADHFQEVVGVDISASMLEEARSHNRHGDRIRFIENTTDDLAVLENDCLDLVYSSITLQHIPPEFASNYIREFFRVLKPGGLACFHVPTGPDYRNSVWRSKAYTLWHRVLRPAGKKIRGLAPVEIHYIPRARVEELVTQSGGRLLDVFGVEKKSISRTSLRYYATKC